LGESRSPVAWTCWRGVELHTHIIEASKARTIDHSHAMVRNKEPFFPPHEDDTTIAIFHGQIRPTKLTFEWTEGRETGPVGEVFLFVCAPVLGEETVPAANDLRVKVCGELWPILGQILDGEVTTERRSGEINVHNGDGDVVAVASALLRPVKLGARVETALALRTHSDTGYVCVRVGWGDIAMWR